MLAADIVNADGLPALVYRMIHLYLAKHGTFIMIAPRPRHRHKACAVRGHDTRVQVDELRDESPNDYYARLGGRDQC